jgi:N-glycosylase/DNA lyase
MANQSKDTSQLKQIGTKDFSLEHTIDCGQFFLYEKNETDQFYYIIQNDNIFKIKQQGDTLLYRGTPNVTDEFITHFFSLDEDLNERTKTFTDSVLTEALEKYWGLRNIRQDLWQCMIGFVCSSASNIPKIKNNLKLLCENFGDKI